MGVGFFRSKSDDFIDQGYTPETITNCNICLKYFYYFLIINLKSVSFCLSPYIYTL